MPFTPAVPIPVQKESPFEATIKRMEQLYLWVYKYWNVRTTTEAQETITASRTAIEVRLSVLEKKGENYNGKFKPQYNEKIRNARNYFEGSFNETTVPTFHLQINNAIASLRAAALIAEQAEIPSLIKAEQQQLEHSRERLKRLKNVYEQYNVLTRMPYCRREQKLATSIVDTIARHIQEISRQAHDGNEEGSEYVSHANSAIIVLSTIQSKLDEKIGADEEPVQQAAIVEDLGMLKKHLDFLKAQEDNLSDELTRKIASGGR